MRIYHFVVVHVFTEVYAGLWVTTTNTGTLKVERSTQNIDNTNTYLNMVPFTVIHHILMGYREFDKEEMPTIFTKKYGENHTDEVNRKSLVTRYF